MTEVKTETARFIRPLLTKLHPPLLYRGYSACVEQSCVDDLRNLRINPRRLRPFRHDPELEAGGIGWLSFQEVKQCKIEIPECCMTSNDLYLPFRPAGQGSIGKSDDVSGGARMVTDFGKEIVDSGAKRIRTEDIFKFI